MAGKSASAESHSLQVGYGRVPMVPRLPFPLAGMVTREERLSGWLLDEPAAVAVAFRRGGTSYVALVADLLIIDTALEGDLRKQAQSLGFAGLTVSASHTHSGPGGYVAGKGGRLFMGRYRPTLRAFLLEQCAAAMAEARADLAAVRRIQHGHTEVAGLTMNRRRKGGPVDDTIQAVRFDRGGKPPVLLANLSGHPVVAAFMAPAAVSADVPGRVRGKLAAQGIQAAIFPGALGGLNLLFPEMETSLKGHLELLEGLVLGGLEAALAKAEESSPDCALSFQEQSLLFARQPAPRSGGPFGQAVRGGLTSLVGDLYARLTAPSRVVVPVRLLRIGPLALAGMPADFGIVATLQLRSRMAAAGIAAPFVVSHANGYVGYVHLADEAAWRPDARPDMHHYENAMAWYGRDTGERLVAAVSDLL